MSFRRLLGAAALSCCACGSTVSLSEESKSIVITASRVEESIDDTLWSTTVIDRAEIEALQVASVPELLRGVAGISMINSGGLGKFSSAFVRGTDSDQVLVLVDGVRVGSATAGTTAFEFLPLEQIERVEIVRGPRSTLYGSEAVGGVIQFFTRKSTEPGLAMNASAGAGSHSTWRNSVNLSANGANAWLNLSGDRVKSDGINACRGSFSGGCFTVEPDADGFESLNGLLRTGYRFGDAGELELHVLNADGESEFDGSFGNSVEFVQRAASLQGRFNLPGGWKLTTLAGRGEDRQENFQDGTWLSKYNTRRDSASAQLDHNGLSMGLDYYLDKVISSEDFEETERDNKAAFAQYMTKTGAHSWLAGVRHDDNEQFGGHTTGNLGWGWAFTDHLRLSATAGTAFKAPSFNDLYFPGGFGNPDLRPEESRSYELGLTGALSAGRWSLRAYRTTITDLIVFQAIPVNLDEALAQGVEAQLSWTVDEWEIGAQAGWLDTENRSNGANRGNKLNRRPDEAASVNVRHRFGPVYLGVTGIYEGRRFDNLANTLELGSYFTLDLTAEMEFAQHWSVGARVANAFDRDYTTIAFYNQDERNWSLTVRYR